MLAGTPRDIADKLRYPRGSYGLAYVTVQDTHADFAKVIAELR